MCKYEYIEQKILYIIEDFFKYLMKQIGVWREEDEIDEVKKYV